jgi:hypothetical protein
MNANRTLLSDRIRHVLEKEFDKTIDEYQVNRYIKADET